MTDQQTSVVTTVHVEDLPTLPALVHGTVWHRRHRPIDRSFRHRVYQWLVDVDDLPVMPRALRPFTRLDSRDHLGGRAGSGDLRTNVERFLQLHGVALGGGRIVMLANARVAGHVFDPLTVFWCFGGSGTLECVIAEVHNTYGEWHAYLLRPDRAGVAVAAKELYVSPFYDVSGTYHMRFDICPDAVDLTVTLQRDGAVEFEAGFIGSAIAARPATVARALLRHPLMPQRVSALIRAHGAVLWMRGLPITPRPHHVVQDGV